MQLKEWVTQHKKESATIAIVFLLLGLLICFLIIYLIFYTPKPRLIDAPVSTKDAKISLRGQAAPRAGIAVFDKDGNSIVLTQTNEQGEFALSGLPIIQGKNEFRLRAIMSKYKVSLPLIVIIDKDTMAPALEVSKLAGATVTGSNTVISGKAEPGSTVTINGVKTTVNPDGNWTATVALQSGKNKVTVSATDPAGNTTTDTQTIQYIPTSSGSQTGTASVTTSTVSISAGSTPATSTGSTAGIGTSAGTGAGASTATSASAGGTGTGSAGSSNATSSSPGTTTAPPPPPPLITEIIVTTYVSNPSPNDRANETIYATVKDNFGRPVTNASVVATVNFKTGAALYSLSHQGNGLYLTSFKLNDKYASGYKVDINITARLEGLTAWASTSFTPN